MHSTSNSARTRSSSCVSATDPTSSRRTSGVSFGSSGVTSSVIMPVSRRARSAISAWPISPPAPVTRTTGLRTAALYRGALPHTPSPGGSRFGVADLTWREIPERRPRVRILAHQRVEIERDVVRWKLRLNLCDSRRDLFRIGFHALVLNKTVFVGDTERVEKLAHHLALLS